MALIFAGIVPHPPFLLPGLKDTKEAQALSKTKQAMAELSERLVALQPDTVVALSQHGSVDDTAFSINLAQGFEGSFEQFGDLKTKVSFRSDVETTSMLNEAAIADGLSVRLIHEPQLDYGTAIPLLTLGPLIPTLSVLPIVPSHQPYAEHRRFGSNLFQSISASPKRIAVIASADLSHHLTKDAPGGFNPEAVKEMQLLLDHLEAGKFAPLFSIDELRGDALFECGLRPLLILLGMIETVSFQPRLLSNEAPNGVGYVVMDFILPF